MRLFVFNCLLLASVATSLPNGRQKRDLSYLKNLICSAIFGRSQINIQPPPVLQTETEYKLFQVPGYDDIMIEVAPRRPVVEEFVYPAVQPVNLNAFGTVVGTETADDTLVAVKEVDNLLSTGILYGGHNNVMEETIVPMFPSLNTDNYVIEEEVKTDPVLETRPVLTEVIRPLEEKLDIKLPFEPIYFYEQTRNDEPVMTHTAHSNPDVEVVETVKMNTELPMCIKKRVDEAILLGADPNRYAPVQKVYQYQTPSVVDFSYPRVETNSYLQNSFPGEVLSEKFGTVGVFELPLQRLRPLKDSPVRHNVRPLKSQPINHRPLLMNSHTSPHFGAVNIRATKDSVNSQTRKAQAYTNLGDKVNISQTMGPLPPQYIRYVSNIGGNSAVTNEKIVKQMKAVPIVSSKDNVSNAKIPSNVYRLQSNPNTGKVMKGSNTLRTNVKTNPDHYVIAPAVNSQASKKDTFQVKDGLYTNKVTTKPQSVTRPVIVSSTNLPKEDTQKYIQTSFKNNPIVVPDVKTYSYQQINADGSSMNVRGNKHGVSVELKEDNTKGRGDIPNQ